MSRKDKLWTEFNNDRILIYLFTQIYLKTYKEIILYNIIIRMYLSLKEIKELIFSNFPNSKANIIAKHMKNKCFISNSKLYSLTSQVTYDVTTGNKVENKLLNCVTTLLQQSYDKLEDLEKQRLVQLKNGLLHLVILMFVHIFHN
jgi:hypothetical protein